MPLSSAARRAYRVPKAIAMTGRKERNKKELTTSLAAKNQTKNSRIIKGRGREKREQCPVSASPEPSGRRPTKAKELSSNPRVLTDRKLDTFFFCFQEWEVLVTVMCKQWLVTERIVVAKYIHSLKL
ncbi:hypothetical protein V6N13_110761 [Hibiscus sabdariffa]